MTDVDRFKEELRSPETNPKDVKLKLAFGITKIFNGEEKAQEELEYFTKTFSERQTPSEMTEVKIGQEMSVLEILKKCFGEEKSSSDIRRLIEQKAVSFDGKVADDPSAMIEIPEAGAILKVGKLNWFKIKR